MTRKFSVYNTSDSPIAIDDEGHMLDGHSWIERENTSEQIERGVTAGVLIVNESDDPVDEEESETASDADGEQDNSTDTLEQEIQPQTNKRITRNRKG